MTDPGVLGVKQIAVGLLAATFLLAGCSNVKSETFTSSNKDQVMTDIGTAKLSDDDQKAVVGAITRSALGNYPLEGKTVGQVIDEQKKWQADQDAQAAAAQEAQLKIEAARAALVDKMQHVLAVQPISKRFQEADYDAGDYNEHEVLELQIHNRGSKIIKGFKGSLYFTNSFGDKVINLSLEVGGDGGDAISLAPGHIGSDEESWTFNKFEDQWTTFDATALSSMKAQWVPDQIIFADGSTLRAPDDDSSSS